MFLKLTDITNVVSCRFILVVVFSNLSSNSRWHRARACRPMHVQTPSKRKLWWGICHCSSVLPLVLACMASSCGNWLGRGLVEAVCGQGRWEKFQFASLAGLRSTTVFLEMPSGRGLFFPLKASGVLSSEWGKKRWQRFVLGERKALHGPGVAFPALHTCWGTTVRMADLPYLTGRREGQAEAVSSISMNN